MNEQLAAIRARREAALSVNPRTAAASSVYSIPVLYATSRYLPKEAIDKAARLAEFVNAAPGDIDTLLAEVERLTALDETRRRLQDDAQVIAVEARRKEADAVVALAALTAERDNARGQVEALTFERDQVRAAWHKALDQVAREQELTRQAMKRALELNRTAQQYNAVVRSAFTPEQWMAAAAVAQERYPNVFDKEPHP